MATGVALLPSTGLVLGAVAIDAVGFSAVVSGAAIGLAVALGLAKRASP
jgi:hypothetical protein